MRVITLLSFLLLSLQSFAGEYLVKLRTPYALSFLSHAEDYKVLDYHEPGQLMKVYIGEDKKISATAKLLSNPQVEYMVPNFRLKAFEAPVDVQALKEQYALARVRAEEAWKKAGNRGSKKVVVAVIDTGVDYRHPDLAPNMIAGYDFAGRDNDPMDETSFQNPGHGTHVAGIVGAIALILGGILLIWLDKRTSRDHISIQELSFKQAFFIGVIQSLALIPGTSRSAAAILGGLWLGMDKKSATEYSFLLGLPTLGAASLYKTIKILPQVTPNQWSSLALGTLLSFLFAVGAIKLLTTIVARYGLYHFGYYRIALGAAVLGASLWGI